MTDNELYLGRLYDSQNKKTTENKFTYDPADLTTHAVVTGMTGSGKTGLCITLLEEAALQGIPALIIAPCAAHAAPGLRAARRPVAFSTADRRAGSCRRCARRR